jgi:hypothetical protein
MSFKFFRKHQKVMLWIIVVITVFTFSLFSVTSTMRTCFKEKENVDAVAEFEDSSGKTVEVDLRKYWFAGGVLRLATMMGIYPPATEEDVLSFVMLTHEADRAGISVADEEVADFVSFFMRMNQLSTSKEDYRRMVRMLGIDIPRFEDNLRAFLKVDKYKRLVNITQDWVTSEDLYDEYKLENEEFKLAYVNYPYSDYDDEMDPSTVSEEELREWFDGLSMFSSEVREYLSHPEEFEFDVAYIDLASADLDSYADLVEEEEPDAFEVQRYYDAVKDPRFKVEPTEEEPAEEETPEDEAPEEETPEEAEPEVEYVEMSEVKDELEQELKVAKLVEKACTEWVEYAREQDIIGKADEEAPEEEESTEEKETPDEHFDALLEKYRLSKDRVEGPVKLDDIKTLEGYGSDYLSRRIRHLQRNNGVYISPRTEHPGKAFFIRVTKKVERKKMEFDEAREAALERYLHRKKFEMAQKDGMKLINAMKDKARELPEVQEVINQWKEDAKNRALDSIENLGVIAPDELEARLSDAEEQEMRRMEGEINRLLDSHLYKFWDEEVKAQELVVHEVDYYNKSIIRDPEFLQREDSPDKYVMSYRRIFDLGKNTIMLPINDRTGESWMVVRVVDRRFPPPSTMTEQDYLDTKMAMEQKRMQALRARAQGQTPGALGMGNQATAPQDEPEPKPDPFSFKNLSEKYSLRLYKKAEDEAEGEQPAEESNSTP